MGFGQGLSGLNAASQNLDVIGNNIANAGTVGFKAGSASFADVYASSRVGLGVQVAGINQRFTVGNVSVTGGQFHIAIDGAKGMFRLVDTSGQVLYSRNGEFFADKDNYITNLQGHRLTGYPIGGVGLDPVPLTVPRGNIAPQATSQAGVVLNVNANAPVISETGAAEQLGSLALIDSTGATQTYTFRLNSTGGYTWVGAAPTDGELYTEAGGAGTVTFDGGQPQDPVSGFDGYVAYQAAVPAVPFSPTNPASYTHLVPTSVYDSLGNAHQLVQYLVKREGLAGEASQWDAYYYLDGQPMDVPAGGGPVAMTFTPEGVLSSQPGVTLTYTQPGGLASPAEPLVIALDYTGTTQYGGALTQNVTPDGYPTGEFASVSIDADGTLMANYTNGEQMAFGTVVLANFNNLQGLQPVGSNAWIETSASGQAILGQPGTNGLAQLRGQALEESNVDMSQELVNMIIAQRAYQANAQTIRTQDQVLQTLMQIR
ncbi:flagellar hook-basal body complex protein [Orrella sp. JC864]|uniref:flagellar hook-basal body complex protein n=1 Tax=Orrella sp. JC864 TaxID=3120298 RepID=UPI0012BD576C